MPTEPEVPAAPDGPWESVIYHLTPSLGLLVETYPVERGPDDPIRPDVQVMVLPTTYTPVELRDGAWRRVGPARRDPTADEALRPAKIGDDG